MKKTWLITAVLITVALLMLAPFVAPQNEPLGTTAPLGTQLLSAIGESPIAWWPADGTAIDIVNRADGVPQNGSGYEKGVAGQAFAFNGVDQNVTVANGRAWNFGDHDFSIMLWAKSNAAGQPAPFISHDEGGGDMKKWIFWAGWTYGLVFHFNSPATGGFDVVACYSCSLTPGQWYHLAVTRKGPVYALYINGMPVARATDGHVIPAANAPLQIGAAEGIYFDGSIDEVKVYQRALSAAEVRSFGFMQGAAAVTAP